MNIIQEIISPFFYVHQATAGHVIVPTFLTFCIFNPVTMTIAMIIIDIINSKGETE